MKNESVIADVPVGKNHPVRIMGVINVSPESFYKGSVHTKSSAIARAARQMTREGADFIDVGALSTAPYLQTHISEQKEAARLEKAVRTIRKNTPLPISIDTSRPLPAMTGLKAGGRIINDIHGLSFNPRMAALAQKADGLILMANPVGRPEERFNSPVHVTMNILRQSLRLARSNRIPESKIVVDPGIGFFRKTQVSWWQWDATVIKELQKIRALSVPILIGISRKSFIGAMMNDAPPAKRLPGSIAATVVAVMNGASIIRTHDVAATKAALQIAETLRKPL